MNSPEEAILMSLINGIGHTGEFNPVDNTVMNILMNNGCASSDKPESYIAKISDSVCIDYIDGMIGNAKLQYYDTYKMDGVIHLVIFLDLVGIKSDKDKDDILGNSATFYKIMNIYEMANLLVYKVPMLDAFLQTSAGMSMRYTRTIVAYIVLSRFSTVTEVDIENCGLSIEEISDMISKVGIKNILLGIRTV